MLYNGFRKKKRNVINAVKKNKLDSIVLSVKLIIVYHVRK